MTLPTGKAGHLMLLKTSWLNISPCFTFEYFPFLLSKASTRISTPFLLLKTSYGIYTPLSTVENFLSKLFTLSPQLECLPTFYSFLLLSYLPEYLPILYFWNFQLKYLISSFLTESLSAFFHRTLLPEYQPTFYSWKLPKRNTFLLPSIENFLPGYLPTFYY